MNVGKVQSKKGHEVLDHEAGFVKGYKMCFDIGWMPRVEPAFANAVVGTADDSIHGVAIKLSAEDMAKLDAQEGSYDKIKITVEGYSGRKIEECSMYIGIWNASNDAWKLPTDKQIPSPRYLKLLVDGAKEAGLDSEYVNRLESTITYSADEATLARRKELPEPRTLTPYLVDELFLTKAQSLGTKTGDVVTPGEFAFVACLGYVIKMPRNRCFFQSHLGRDITARSLRHFRGQPLDKDDDMGKPPYPDAKSIQAEEREYLYNWLDHYLDKGEVVGYVTEYLQHHESN